MKKFTLYKKNHIKCFVILLGMLFLEVNIEIRAQHVSNNAAYISISNDTTISMDSIYNDNTSILSNNGTLTVSDVHNAGNAQGDGIYNISGNVISTGIFFSETGTVNMTGTAAQTMEMGVSTLHTLTIDNAQAVTLNSTQTTLTNTLTINSGKIFKIEAAKSLTVTGTIANYAGTSGLVLKSNTTGTASLTHNTASVPATVQRYISGAPEDWHFLSAPVSNQSISGNWNPTGTYGNGTGYDLYIFNEPTPCWTYQLNTTVAPTWASIHPTSNFVKGRGYLYAVQVSNPTKEFIGALNNGNISYPITNESPDPDIKGFNLVGNPYPSAIDWKSENGWSRTDLIASGDGYDMWIWNPSANNYGVYNSAGSSGTNGVTQFIAPTQGYFIRAAVNGSINISNDTRVHTGANNWFKGENKKTNSLKIRITSTGGDGYDEALLQFGYPENEAGALKLFSQNDAAPSAYFSYLDKKLSVRYLTDTIENSKVKMSFKAGKIGDYSLAIGPSSASFGVLLLEDKKTQLVTDINTTSIYKFKGTPNDAEDRFTIHFKEITEALSEQSVLIYYDGNKINVDLTKIDEQSNIKIYDLLGRVLVNKAGANKIIHRFAIDSKQGIYIVEVKSGKKTNSRIVVVY